MIKAQHVAKLAGGEPDVSETYCPACGAGTAVEKYVFVQPDQDNTAPKEAASA